MTQERLKKIKELTCRETGRRGGIATFKKYGYEYFVAIGKKGGNTPKNKPELIN